MLLFISILCCSSLSVIAIILLVLFLKSCNKIDEEAVVANFATTQSFTG